MRYFWNLEQDSCCSITPVDVLWDTKPKSEMKISVLDYANIIFWPQKSQSPRILISYEIFLSSIIEPLSFPTVHNEGKELRL